MRIFIGCFVVTIFTAAAIHAADADPKSAAGANGVTVLAEWPLAAASKEKLPKTVAVSAVKWTWLQYNDMELAVGVTEFGYGESYIDVGGYVYNRSAKEWRRFLVANTRNAGGVDVLIDKGEGMLKVMGKANNNLKGKTIIAWNLGALSDDRAYTH